MESLEKKNSPHTSKKFKEGKHQINKSKVNEWMGMEIKMKEVHISIDNIHKLAKIGDYWSKQQTIEIVNLHNEH